MKFNTSLEVKNSLNVILVTHYWHKVIKVYVLRGGICFGSWALLCFLRDFDFVVKETILKYICIMYIFCGLRIESVER